jgi:hypothetical protein
MALVVPNIFSTSNTSVFTLAQLDANFAFVFTALATKGAVLAQGPTTGSFSVPSGVTALRIVLNAGGGGGAGCVYTNAVGIFNNAISAHNSGGSGGAGGNVYFVITNLTAGTVFTYTLGAAGAAGTDVQGGTGTAGGAGGLSTLSCAALGFTVTCTGGGGGQLGGSISVAAGGAAGAGGSYSFTYGTATIGTISGSTVNGIAGAAAYDGYFYNNGKLTGRANGAARAGVATTAAMTLIPGVPDGNGNVNGSQTQPYGVTGDSGSSSGGGDTTPANPPISSAPTAGQPGGLFVQYWDIFTLS